MCLTNLFGEVVDGELKQLGGVLECEEPGELALADLLEPGEEELVRHHQHAAHKLHVLAPGNLGGYVKL